MKPLILAVLLVHAAAKLTAHPGSGIAVDAQGRVFFTAGSMIVRVETNGVAHTIIHDVKHEKFYQLHHIQRAPDGGLLTASDIGNAIWRFTPEGGLSRFYPPPNQGRPLSVGSGGDPFAVDNAGNVYAVNSVQGRFTQILKISAEGRVSVLAGGDWGFTDGKGTDAKFGDLHGGSIIVAPGGSLLLTDGLTRVRRITPDGTVTTLAGGSQVGHVDGPGSRARFDGASGLVLLGDGHLLVVDSGEVGQAAGRIRRIAPDGSVATLAGGGGNGSKDGPLLEATFDGPKGIALAPNGDILILEPDGPRVRKISGGKVSTIHQGLP
jgi:hypothetical protein